MLELIDSFEALTNLADEWRALCDRAPQATIFQTPEWLLPWWKHLGGGEICSLALRTGGRLCGLAPLFRHGVPGENIRQISLIGAGITDYLDFIAEPEVAQEFTREVRAWLNGNRLAWDVIHFEELRPGAMARDFGEFDPCSVCPVIELPDSVDRWEASLDKTHRRNVRHARSHGEFTFEASTDAKYFGDFVRLHELSWSERNQEGVVNTAALRHFYGEVAQSLAAAGVLRMLLLRHGDTIAGAIFGMAWKCRGYAYLGGFDPALSKTSPGTVLMWHAIGNAISTGLQEWDFLRGPEQYKYLWGALGRANVQIRIE